MRFTWLLKARLRNQVFFCRALQGESNYNICINCDLTVSCNCQDFDGSGRIGSLQEETLEQVFRGPKAQGFRNALSKRKFPIDFCPICPELSLVSKERSESCLTGFRVPHRGIMVENTVLCNLRCGLCRRGELLEIRGSKFLSLEDLEKIATFLNENKLESVYYFNLGEPFLAADIYRQIKIIRAKNPDIRIITSTNGVLLDSDEKIEAALLMDYIYFSMDGIDQQMATKYQVGLDFDKSYRNMVRLMQLRDQRAARQPIVEWKYVLFRWNDRPAHVERAIEMARNAKVDVLGFYPGAAPLHKRSFRYARHPYFRTLGERVGEATIINFNQIPRQFLSP